MSDDEAMALAVERWGRYAAVGFRLDDAGELVHLVGEDTANGTRWHGRGPNWAAAFEDAAAAQRLHLKALGPRWWRW